MMIFFPRVTLMRATVKTPIGTFPFYLCAFDTLPGSAESRPSVLFSKN